ncbi:DEKNAAC101121 [Brettanomyces naardenensis]|uniref:DEKNAAC101121 n=1 Tax=Brettanomyces naardenensis TaxID=13370 RepID=A0A448YHI8_BRENA|nr:DEKNAAC101121 [Brettanomyces naardenensis]
MSSPTPRTPLAPATPVNFKPNTATPNPIAASGNGAPVGSPSAYRAIPIPNRQPRHSRSNVFASPLSTINASSLSAFVGSFQRAQSFRSLEPRVRAARSYFQDEEELIDPQTLAPSQLGRKISTIFAQANKPNFDISTTFDEAAVDDTSFLDQSYADYNVSRETSLVSSRQPSMVGSQSLARIVTNDAESIFLRRVESRTGVKLTMVVPRSTVAQTVFNSINVLIGVGLLALSTAMTHSGWLWGCILLIYSASITFWTANLLSRCMDTDPTLCTYADLGYKAYGPKARLYISILFSVELLGVGVSLIVLFADSLNALFPQITTIQFKLIGFCILTPLSFLSLRVLSGISLLGIISTVSLVILITTIGLAKTSAPGSLIDPAPTYTMPPSLMDLCLSYGIILGPFGSHSLFPALKSDLATPQDFKKCLKVTYSVGFIADSTMAIIGFAMFGAHVMNEITKSVIITPGYPQIVYVLTSCFVSMVPIAKIPINALPIINIIEYMFELSPQQLESRKITFPQKIVRTLIKVFVNGMFVLCAILYPEFDKIIGLSGASLCTLICIALPCGFYIQLCHPKNVWFYYAVIVASLILGSVSTYAAIVA